MHQSRSSLMRSHPRSRFVSAQTARRLQKRFWPCLEALEDRTVPAYLTGSGSANAFGTLDLLPTAQFDPGYGEHFEGTVSMVAGQWAAVPDVTDPDTQYRVGPRGAALLSADDATFGLTVDASEPFPHMNPVPGSATHVEAKGSAVFT